MNEFALKQSVKKIRLLLIFFVFFTLFISENLSAIKHWNSSYVKFRWIERSNTIIFTIVLYDYAFITKSEHGFLEHLKIEASVDGIKYFRLMKISTKRQTRSNKTTVYLTNKLDKSQIKILDNNFTPSVLRIWPDWSSSKYKVEVPNSDMLAAITLGWVLGRDYRDVSYMRIFGIWYIDAPYSKEIIDHIVYEINKTGQPLLKSSTRRVNAEVLENDPVKVFNDSEAMVIKGADLGENIKVYSTTGVEINSVISSKDEVKIQLPANQIYLVHIGESRYKVAL